MTSPNDTGPIASQCILTKLFDKCLLNQLDTYFSYKKFLSDKQFGFRRGQGAAHAVIAIADYIKHTIDKNLICVLTAIDVSKAFDTVDRKIMLHKPDWYGINHNVITSMINERTQFVCVCIDGVEKKILM